MFGNSKQLPFTLSLKVSRRLCACSRDENVYLNMRSRLVERPGMI